MDHCSNQTKEVLRQETKTKSERWIADKATKRPVQTPVSPVFSSVFYYHAKLALAQLYSAITKQQGSNPDRAFIVAGDFNQLNQQSVHLQSINVTNMYSVPPGLLKHWTTCTPML